MHSEVNNKSKNEFDLREYIHLPISLIPSSVAPAPLRGVGIAWSIKGKKILNKKSLYNSFQHFV